MAGMQRFVTYIYSYENNQKMNNSGYAKLETRGTNGRMEIHFCDNEAGAGILSVSCVYEKERRMLEIPFGTMGVENGLGIGLFAFHTESVQGTGVAFEQIVGIKMKDSKDREYKSFWRDVEVCETDKEEMFVPSENETETEGEYLNEEEVLHTAEIPVRNVFPVYTMEDIWNALGKNRDYIKINDETGGLRIELSDLRELPKQYWYLGNNSFLLHGFFNYHYLLFGKLSGDRWFLGVPGIYERQERVMASVFGFPGFMYVTDINMSENAPLSGAIPNETRYGIWYHILEA